MSALHPIVAVTGSSGAGSASVKRAFEHIFTAAGVNAAAVEGDSFHRFDREDMHIEVGRAAGRGETLTHFGPAGNLLPELEALFAGYAEHGRGRQRTYVHTEDEAVLHGVAPGRFTDWRDLPEPTDLLFYEGLHGGFVGDEADIARHVDLLIGMVPIVNFEWAQKIHRDRAVRGYSTEAATAMILRRMPDYVHYICPQFSRTDINFQPVPTIDTSNPFILEELPSYDESMVVIHVQNRAKLNPDYPYLLGMLDGAFVSKMDTLVVPASRLSFAMELLLLPVIERLVATRTAALDQSAA
ncbi:MAG: phosphoribulokinase [Gammaproteobacteria bacterium]|nr:phosphoribulokinase [Gammaproteobacteria bacterium]MCP5200474.1 phosphoribulokinase [Gammaproteobacteria bacterium]